MCMFFKEGDNCPINDGIVPVRRLLLICKSLSIVFVVKLDQVLGIVPVN